MVESSLTGARSGLLCLVSALCACAGGDVRSPDAALRAYLSAAQSGDANAAYALLDDDTQDAVTLEEFSASMQDNEGLAALATGIPRNVLLDPLG